MFATDETTRAGRMMSAGRVTVTFTSPHTGEHITVAAKSRKPDENGKWVGCPLAEAKVVFFSVPNQTGWDDKVGKFTRAGGFTPDHNADPARVFCAKQLVKFVAGEPTAPGLECREESRCGRCGRQLTDPVSIDRGIGPECAGKETGSSHQKKGETVTAVEEDHGNRMEREMIEREMAAI